MYLRYSGCFRPPNGNITFHQYYYTVSCDNKISLYEYPNVKIEKPQIRSKVKNLFHIKNNIVFYRDQKIGDVECFDSFAINNESFKLYTLKDKIIYEYDLFYYDFNFKDIVFVYKEKFIVNDRIYEENINLNSIIRFYHDSYLLFNENMIILKTKQYEKYKNWDGGNVEDIKMTENYIVVFEENFIKFLDYSLNEHKKFKKEENIFITLDSRCIEILKKDINVKEAKKIENVVYVAGILKNNNLLLLYTYDDIIKRKLYDVSSHPIIAVNDIKVYFKNKKIENPKNISLMCDCPVITFNTDENLYLIYDDYVIEKNIKGTVYFKNKNVCFIKKEVFTFEKVEFVEIFFYLICFLEINEPNKKDIPIDSNLIKSYVSKKVLKLFFENNKLKNPLRTSEYVLHSLINNKYYVEGNRLLNNIKLIFEQELNFDLLLCSLYRKLDEKDRNLLNLDDKYLKELNDLESIKSILVFFPCLLNKYLYKCIEEGKEYLIEDAIKYYKKISDYRNLNIIRDFCIKKYCFYLLNLCDVDLSFEELNGIIKVEKLFIENSKSKKK